MWHISVVDQIVFASFALVLMLSGCRNFIINYDLYFALKDQPEDSAEQSAPASPSSSQTKDGLFKEPLVMPDSEPHDENLTEQTHHIIIPSYASWFDYNRYSIAKLWKRASHHPIPPSSVEILPLPHYKKERENQGQKASSNHRLVFKFTVLTDCRISYIYKPPATVLVLHSFLQSYRNHNSENFVVHLTTLELDLCCLSF